MQNAAVHHPSGGGDALSHHDAASLIEPHALRIAPSKPQPPATAP